MLFSNTIIDWYKKNKRNFPWRKTKNPYKIWLSEIILQQTRVEQGLPYYTRFIQEYPTLEKLAEADEETILKLWQGLGYYSRARNMLETAKYICSNLNGKFPSKYKELIKLKGIGSYTAAAISSFAFNKPHAVVDGNVNRVLSRFSGIKTPIDSLKGKEQFLALAQKLLDKKNPDLFNQAIMEFGAIQCKISNPLCSICPFIKHCYAYKHNIVTKLPIKSKKIIKKDRYLNYLVLKHKGNMFIKKRNKNDIWKNMFDFPSIETKCEVNKKELIESSEWTTILKKSNFVIKSISKQFKHILTHQNIYGKFFEIEIINGNMPNYKGLISVNKKEIKNFAVPKLIDNYFQNKYVSCETN